MTVTIRLSSSLRKPKKVQETLSLTKNDRLLKTWKAEQLEIYSQLGINVMSKDQLVFSSHKNTYMTLPSVGHKIDALSKKRSVKRITPHGFRHTH